MRTKTIQKELKKYLLESINNEGEYFANDKDAINHFFEMFDVEYNNAYTKRIYPNIVIRVAEYLKGLPSCIDIAFSDYDIVCTIEKWSGNPLTEKQKEIVIADWWTICAYRLVSMYNYLNKLS